jgi:hypothetical protein
MASGARAAERARARLVHAVEALEDAAEILLGNPDSGIRDAHPDLRIAALDADLDPTTRLGVLHGVVEQVADDLLESVRIRPGHHTPRCLRYDIETPFAKTRPGIADQRRHDLAHVERRGLETDAPAFDRRELEQVVDDVGETLRMAVDDLEIGTALRLDQSPPGATPATAMAASGCEARSWRRSRRTSSRRQLADVVEDGHRTRARRRRSGATAAPEGCAHHGLRGAVA